MLKEDTTSTSYTDSQPFPGINFYGVIAYNESGDASGSAISESVPIKAPEIIGIYGYDTSLNVEVKDLDVPDSWKSSYKFVVYSKSSSNYLPWTEWSYNEHKTYVSDRITFEKEWPQAAFSGKTFNYRFFWQFKDVTGKTTDKTVTHN